MAETTELAIQAGGHSAAELPSPFHVPLLFHSLGGLVQRSHKALIWLANLESRQVADQLRRHPVRSPIYICGLARSGSTLLHELIASHPGVATQRVKDYPMVFTPYWWRRATARMPSGAPRERLHRDGVVINTESPDALEEMLWTAFFPRCHDPSMSAVMTGSEQHPAFEAFYDQHLRKLLLAEGATRYVAKANYHVARLAYLHRLYPEARFIVPIRSPESHVASLLRQHRWFSQGQREHPRALAYMQRTGHFEFGLDRRPMHLGDGERVREIEAAWGAGEEIRGLAMYWDMVYGYLAKVLEAHPSLRDATLVVRFESICAADNASLNALLDHCALPKREPVAERYRRLIRPPQCRASEFSPSELAILHEETSRTIPMWGY